MELSWRYKDTMRRIVQGSAYRILYAWDGNYFPTALVVNISRDGFDAPLFCIGECTRWLSGDREESFELVLPLCADNSFKQCSGGDAILNYFGKGGSYNTERLAAVRTPKGEVYYGNKGIILDKDFDPLFLSTIRIDPTSDGNFAYGGITIHLSPKVFTDDTSILNKSLAKKGMQYFLSTEQYFFSSLREVKISIGDISGFVKKVEKPNLSDFSEDSIQRLLQDNIEDVLRQFDYDKAIHGH